MGTMIRLSKNAMSVASICQKKASTSTRKEVDELCLGVINIIGIRSDDIDFEAIVNERKHDFYEEICRWHVILFPF